LKLVVVAMFAKDHCTHLLIRSVILNGAVQPAVNPSATLAAS
jgi:hypothetical protein